MTLSTQSLARFVRDVDRIFCGRRFLRSLTILTLVSTLLMGLSWTLVPQMSRSLGLFCLFLGWIGSLGITKRNRLSPREVVALTDRTLGLEARLISFHELLNSPDATAHTQGRMQHLLSGITLPRAQTILPLPSSTLLALTCLSISAFAGTFVLCSPPMLPGQEQETLALQSRQRSASQIQQSLRDLPSSPLRDQTALLIQRLRDPDIPNHSVRKETTALTANIRKWLATPSPPMPPLERPSQSASKAPQVGVLPLHPAHPRTTPHLPSASPSTTPHAPSRPSTSPAAPGVSVVKRNRVRRTYERLEARLLATEARLQKHRDHLLLPVPPSSFASSSPSGSTPVSPSPSLSAPGSGPGSDPGTSTHIHRPSISTHSSFQIDTIERDYRRGYLSHQESWVARQYLILHRRRGDD